MGTALAIVLLIVFGILLILLEFLVVPGITIAGIGGLAMMAGSVYLGYSSYSTETGTLILVGNLIALVIALGYALRGSTWQKFMLNSEITSHAFDKNEEEDTEEKQIHPGDTGLAVSRLNPIGKIFIKDTYIEGKALNVYIDPQTKVEVVKVFPNQIVVKPKT